MESPFNKVADLEASRLATLPKETPTQVFLVKFAIFLRIPLNDCEPSVNECFYNIRNTYSYQYYLKEK